MHHPPASFLSRARHPQVRTALGIKQTIISGGGSLAAHLDLFFEALGIPLLNGWGLTETSPVLACRRCDVVVKSWLWQHHVCMSAGIPSCCSDQRHSRLHTQAG
jgi:acyl-CoA synthetase (AMP-forming)/AMP-acid ligase II